MEEKIRRIKEILDAYDVNPDGYCYMTNASGIYIKSVAESIKDIQIRLMLGSETRADKLLMDIIANNIYPSF